MKAHQNAVAISSIVLRTDTVFPLINTHGVYLTLRRAALKKRVKKRGTNFKVTEIIHMKSQNFVILSFQIKIINFIIIYSFMYSRTTSYFQVFTGYILVPYAFQFSYG